MTGLSALADEDATWRPSVGGRRWTTASWCPPRSNVEFDVGRTFPHIRPGEAMPLTAWLTPYRRPITSANVVAQVTALNGATSEHRFGLDPTGQFVASIRTSMRGVYRCRLVAAVRQTLAKQHIDVLGVPDPEPFVFGDIDQEFFAASCRRVPI